jgi:phospholipid/cholesterol/gamma-HCH transport system substrate-binding protein
VPSAEVFQHEDYLDGIVAKNPLTVMESVQSALQIIANLEGEVRQALVSVHGAGQEVGAMARSLGAVVDNNQDQVQRIVSKAERAMDRFDTAVASIDEFIRDNDIKTLLEQGLQQVPELLTDAREVMGSLKTATARADQNLQNIEQLTEPLGQSGKKIANQIERSLNQIDTLLAEFVQFSRALNNSDGTVSQLIHNRELYDRLNQSVANIEALSRRLRPIVEDARVFTDKIARNPGQLGVKGLLSPSQSGVKHLRASTVTRSP